MLSLALTEETICLKKKKAFLGLYLEFESSYQEPHSCYVIDLESENLDSNPSSAPYQPSDSRQGAQRLT